MKINIKNIQKLGQLKQFGYQHKSVKEELRDNLIAKLKNKDKIFDGIIGFDKTVLPDIQRAILSRHNILLLGLRGQAKTRIARQLVELLDEYIPIIEGSEVNDDPLHPISKFGITTISEHGDNTPITWLHRNERYVEKLATPDVSVADLIGDIDPIKAASLKLPYSDERVLHFGLLPRANRCLFVINELPDLQARIQVSLFNALQEQDIQIRGFKIRLPLDVQFIFTANPEDYTNRGSIITPLKDRIESQIMTHYPSTIEDAKAITKQEAHLSDPQKNTIYIPELMYDLLETIVFEARDSDLTDLKSGVSARLSISALENLVSAAERRMLINNESETTVRIADLWGIIPSITGKVELVYEGEIEGSQNVALDFINEAIKKSFDQIFPNPEKQNPNTGRDVYGTLKEWFGDGNSMELPIDASEETYRQGLESVIGLIKLARPKIKNEKDLYFYMELILNGLSEYEFISKDWLEDKIYFGDEISDLFDLDDEDEEDDDF